MWQSGRAIPGLDGVATRMDACDSSIGHLESLILIYHSNKRLLRLLERTKRDLERARAYMNEPGCNLALGIARVGQLRERRRKVLRQLEANWLVIRELAVLPYAG